MIATADADAVSAEAMIEVHDLSRKVRASHALATSVADPDPNWPRIVSGMAGRPPKALGPLQYIKNHESK
jgi:hypothetical protein